MKRYKRVLSIISVVAAVSAMTGCGSNDDASSESTDASDASATRTTLTAPNLQPPSQNNRYAKMSGNPKVVFDPCTWLPDDTVTKLGFDSSTRKRGDDVVAEYTFLTCDFTNQDKAMQLDSGNVPLDDVKQKYPGRTRDVTINGREALMTPNKGGPGDCSVDIRTKVGYFGVTFLLSNQGKARTQPCDGIVEAASTLEPLVGKEN